MDDLKTLRDFGRQLEHEPPPTLVRQRERLLRAGASGPGRRRLGWMMAGLVAVTTALAVAVPALLVGGVDTAGVGVPAEPRPAKVTGALNVLLVGTDSQAGSERFRNGARTDTMMLVHLSADHKNVKAVSIPRDSMVKIPRCGGEPARRALINSAYDTGGMACAVKTVESLTEVRVDHTVEVDFAGFAALVDALGGVEVKLPAAVDDQAAKLRLPAGRQVLTGEQAMGYMRLRRVGDGSDIARIKRQHGVVMAMLRKAKSELTDPVKLREFLTTAARTIRTDAELDVETMIELAVVVRDTEVSIVTVPWRPHPDDPTRVQWVQPTADRLFAQLR
ncbi:LCP family protein [Nonomuraea sp. SBT364]|uniref:LCP family protein n=1 Tax=Nonomuraea sp. SBT364 TaxID=1580530 RepID=UPI00066B56F4|nr:LCP family protein [Nonomuraea sp. SBT364]